MQGTISLKKNPFYSYDGKLLSWCSFYGLYVAAIFI